jgi:hypothetical protein
MRISGYVPVLALAALCSAPVLADGVGRESAARRPNEAGALPDYDTVQTYGEALPSAPVPPLPAARTMERMPLPRTASPLAVLAVSGLMALAAGGGLYRLSRESH